MITISGAPFQSAGLLGTLPPKGVEAQVLKTMENSTENYRCETQAQLQFELSLRREIVEAALALSRSGLRFAVFHKSKCNADFWSRTGNGGFELKRGASAFAAIRDIFENGRKYATECATAMVIVYYGALTRLWSEQSFNRLFPSIYLMNWHRLDPLLAETGTPRWATDILLGDRCYFRNPQVDPEASYLQGENVIVLPDGRYYGHGVGITTGEQILRMLNAHRIEGATEYAYFMENSAARPSFKRLETAAKTSAAQTPAVRPASLVWRPFPERAFG
jgi:protein-glutamine gamma-glutamyltransferase